MAASIVTKEQVFNFCDEIQEGGETPTITLLYPRFNNRGGYSTISKYLKEWKETHKEAQLPQRPPELPDDLIRPVEHALRSVMGKIEERANQRISEIEKRSEADIGAVGDELTTANSEIARLETEDTENKAALDKAKSELEEARQTIAARDEKIGLLEKSVSEHKIQAETSSSELVTINERLSHSETELKEVGAKLQEEHRKNTELDKKVTSLQTKLSAAATETEKKHAEIERLTKKLREAETAQIELVTVKKQLNEAETKLDRADKGQETYRRKAEESERNAISWKAKFEAVTGERDRLTTLFEKLGKKDHEEDRSKPKNDRPDELNLDG